MSDQRITNSLANKASSVTNTHTSPIQNASNTSSGSDTTTKTLFIGAAFGAVFLTCAYLLYSNNSHNRIQKRIAEREQILSDRRAASNDLERGQRSKSQTNSRASSVSNQDKRRSKSVKSTQEAPSSARNQM